MRRSLPHLLVLVASLLVALPSAAQQEQQCEGPEGVERKERPSLIGERTFRRLSAVHEQLGESKYAEATKGLQALEKANLNDYEMAMVNQTFERVSYALVMKEEFPIQLLDEVASPER